MRVLNRSEFKSSMYGYNYPKYYSIWGLNINSDGTKVVIDIQDTKFVLWIYGEQGWNCQLVGNGRYGGRNGYFSHLRMLILIVMEIFM